MKKVLIVTALSGFINTFLLDDIKLYQKNGCKVYCAARKNILKSDDINSYLDPLGVEFFDVPFNSKKPFAYSNFKASKVIKKFLKSEDIDILHIHTPIPAFFLRILCKFQNKNGKKIIYTSHGLSYNQYSSKKARVIYRFLEKWASKNTNTIICINNDDFDEFKKMRCKKVYKINGIGYNYDKYHSVLIDRFSYRSSIGVSEDDIMVLSVGELSRRKNHQIIIKALSGLPSNYVYVICGREIPGSGTEESLKTLAKEKNVRLILLGHRKDIPEIIACSNLGAIPSIREGLGLAGVQSLAGGVPLVGSNVQGIKEYIIEGLTGSLCSPFDEDGFRKAIIYISQNPDLFSKVSCNEIAKKFDNSEVYGTKERIIDEICKN